MRSIPGSVALRQRLKFSIGAPRSATSGALKLPTEVRLRHGTYKVSLISGRHSLLTQWDTLGILSGSFATQFI